MFLTSGFDVQLDLWAHDLVPAQDGLVDLAAALEGDNAAEGMGEGEVGGQVSLDGLFLLTRRALGELADDALDLGDWVVHACLSAALRKRRWRDWK
jgi:hypothetical protein